MERQISLLLKNAVYLWNLIINLCHVNQHFKGNVVDLNQFEKLKVMQIIWALDKITIKIYY
jgi:hypothetical protein